MMDGLNLYEVDPVTTQLTVKPDMQDKIIRSKQRVPDDETEAGKSSQTGISARG